MESSAKECGSMINLMGTGLPILPLGLSMQDTIKTSKGVGKGVIHGRMEADILETGFRIIGLDRVFFIGLMELNTAGHGKTIRRMDMECKYIQMEEYMKGTGLMRNVMEKGRLCILMGKSTMECGKKTNIMEKVC